MPPLLSVRDLTVWLGAEREADSKVLDGISLDISPGEAVGLLGESGSGKTTLARAIMGILPAWARVSAGAVLFRGLDLLTLRPEELGSIRGAQLSMIFQEPALSLNPFRRARDQVADVLAAHAGGGARRCREQADAVLADVDLPGRRLAEAYPHELSGGQRQRLAIAVALACRPALLLADEPTSSLDSVRQAEFLALVLRLKERYGVALLFVSHDPACLARIADRVVVIRQGRIVEEGEAARVFGEPRDPYTRDLLKWAADAV